MFGRQYATPPSFAIAAYSSLFCDLIYTLNTRITHSAQKLIVRHRCDFRAYFVFKMVAHFCCVS